MQLQAYGQKIRVMRCDKCYGIYCKPDVLKKILGKWMSEALDCGSKSVGKEFDKIEDIDCPACQMKMDKIFDQKQPHIWVESCGRCDGIFLDAQEFTDLKYITPVDFFRDIFKGKRAGAVSTTIPLN